MNEKKVLRKNKDMVTRRIEDETILVPIYKTSDEINSIYTLNKSASRVWEMIDGKTTLAVIQKRLFEEFDVTPQEMSRQMAHLLKELQEIKAVCC